MTTLRELEENLKLFKLYKVQGRRQDFDWGGELKILKFANRWGARGSGGELTFHCYF